MAEKRQPNVLLIMADEQLIAAERFKQHGRRTGVLAHLEGLLVDVTGDQNHPGLQTECPHFLAERHAGHLG